MHPPSWRGRAPLATVGALVTACRPRQWSKNLLVVAAPGAAGVLTHPDVAGRVIVAFLSFCMLASATYLFNDLHDRDDDRRHPCKRARPIASGRLGVGVAVAGMIGLAGGGMALAAVLGLAMAGVAAAYLTLTVSYTLWLRDVAVADIAAVAAGFVLRALGGGIATSVPVSRWFLIVTSFAALFLVTGRRYAEAARDRGGPRRSGARAALGAYSADYLRFVLGLTATVTATAYCLWAFQKSHDDSLSWYALTVIPFVLWLLRYALLLDGGDGEAPEDVVMHDRFLLTMSGAWLTAFVLGVYVAG